MFDLHSELHDLTMLFSRSINGKETNKIEGKCSDRLSSLLEIYKQLLENVHTKPDVRKIGWSLLNSYFINIMNFLNVLRFQLEVSNRNMHKFTYLNS